MERGSLDKVNYMITEIRCAVESKSLLFLIHENGGMRVGQLSDCI